MQPSTVAVVISEDEIKHSIINQNLRHSSDLQLKAKWCLYYFPAIKIHSNQTVCVTVTDRYFAHLTYNNYHVFIILLSANSNSVHSAVVESDVRGIQKTPATLLGEFPKVPCWKFPLATLQLSCGRGQVECVLFKSERGLIGESRLMACTLTMRNNCLSLLNWLMKGLTQNINVFFLSFFTD